MFSVGELVGEAFSVNETIDTNKEVLDFDGLFGCLFYVSQCCVLSQESSNQMSE